MAVPSSDLSKVAQTLNEAEEEPEKFWKLLETDNQTKRLVPRLKLVTQLNNLSFGNMNLVKKLSSNHKSLETLAGQSLSSWKSMIGNSRIPAEITGDDKKTSYALSMKRMIDYLYPAESLVRELKSSNQIGLSIEQPFLWGAETD